MRKFAGVLVAAALIVPAGIMAAPGGAAATKPTCTKLTGTATFKPPLPVSKTKTAKPTVTITGAKLAGCTGGGVVGGLVGSTLKFGVASNCSKLIGGQSTKTKGTAKVTWNTKKVSTANVTLVGVTGNPTQQTVSGPITVGQYKGSKLSAKTQFTISGGQCTTKDLSKVTFSLAKGAKLTVK